MKIKAILGIMLGLFLVGQSSYSEEDAKARLLKEYDKIMKERAEENARKAAEAEKLAKEQAAEAERLAAEEAERQQAIENAKNETERKLLEAKTEEERAAIQAQAEAEKKEAEEQARIAKEETIAKLKAERERVKNMTESEKMDVEIKRIKASMEEVNNRIDNYHKANEMIDQIQNNVKNLDKKLGY